MSPANASFERIAFVASPIGEAHEALQRLSARYDNFSAEDADVIVALGGDEGYTLEARVRGAHG